MSCAEGALALGADRRRAHRSPGVVVSAALIGGSDSSASSSAMLGRLEVNCLRQRGGDRGRPFRHPDRRAVAAERVLGDHIVLGSAQQQADRRLVVLMRQQVVDRGHVRTELPQESRLEVNGLQFDDDVAAELQVEEQQVAEELVVADLQPNLPADERESMAELQQELADMVDQPLLQVPLPPDVRIANASRTGTDRGWPAVPGQNPREAWWRRSW